MQKTIVHDARLQGIDVPADADKLWIWNGTNVLKTDRDIYAMIGNRRIDTIAGIPVDTICNEAVEIAMAKNLNRRQSIAKVLSGKDIKGIHHYFVYNSQYYMALRNVAVKEKEDNPEEAVASKAIDLLEGMDAAVLWEQTAEGIMKYDMTRKQAFYLAVERNNISGVPGHVIVETNPIYYKTALNAALGKMMPGSHPP